MLSYDYQGQNYLFQLNDTPGHISFTGEVSRALRGSDGVVLLVDALEGVMTQTETNIRLAVGEERCKPVLFINKVDRLIKELRLTPKEVGKRLEQIAMDVNSLIKKYAPDTGWRVSFQDGTIAIGSAKHGWGFTVDILREKGIDPKIIFEMYEKGEEKWLRENLPLDEPLLRMIVKHLPSPMEAQPEKIKRIWPGDQDSELGRAMRRIDPNGPLMAMITKLFIHPRTKRVVLIGRVFSGTLRAGDQVRLLTAKRLERVQRLGVMEITDILDIPEIPAGNLFALYGFHCPAGETIVAPEMEDVTPFIEIKYVAEPVVSIAIKPLNPQELDKLGKWVKLWVSADPTAQFRIDEETKEYILSGIDPLQLEILTKRINEMVRIKVSPPIIVYREVPTQRGIEVQTKSNNSLNRIKMYVEPLDPVTIDLIRNGIIADKMDRKERARILQEKAGWDSREARRIWLIYGTNVLVDNTRGAQRLDRIKAYIESNFIDFCNGATLAREPTLGVKAVITDAVVHTDPAHTGYSEVRSMVMAALNMSFLTARPRLYEPILRIDITTPIGTEGQVISILNKKRAAIKQIQHMEDLVRIAGEIPAAETQDLVDLLRSATQGRCFWGYEPSGFRELPRAMQVEKIMEIRKRKGLPLELPQPKLYEKNLYPVEKWTGPSFEI